jgi:hypothetical protein
MSLFGRGVVFPTLLPLGLSQLILAVWLITKGFRAQPSPTPMATKKAPARFVETMHCLPISQPPERPEWTYEIKLYRLATAVWTWSFARKTCDEKRTPHVHG